MSDTKRKTIIGIILIAVSLAALIFWEAAGRKLCTTTEVLSAGVFLKEGDTINIEEMSSVRLPSEGAAKSWLSPSMASVLEGRICAIDIEAGEPLTEAMFREKNTVLEKGYSIFSIPKDWIASRPAMLRAGDKVTLYSLPSGLQLGSFEIAFTRDSAEQAITGDEASSSDVLTRDSSSGIIESVEIICRPQDYFRLYELSLTSGIEPEIPEEGSEPAEESAEEYFYEEIPEDREPFLLLVLKEAR